MLQALHKLEKLNVEECSSVKEVFQLEGREEEHQVKPLRRLRILELWHLLGLMHLWKKNNKSSPDLQSLESLEVWHCDSLIFGTVLGGIFPKSCYFRCEILW